MTFRDFIRSLFGLPALDHSVPSQTIDDGGDYYLGTPKPGALVQEIGANFPNPFGMPIGFLFDLANTPDYSTVVNGGNRRSVLDILNGLFPGTTPTGNTGNPVLDFVNGFTPTFPTILTPDQVLNQMPGQPGQPPWNPKTNPKPEDWGFNPWGPDIVAPTPTGPELPPVITNPNWDVPTIIPFTPAGPGGNFVV